MNEEKNTAANKPTAGATPTGAGIPTGAAAAAPPSAGAAASPAPAAASAGKGGGAGGGAASAGKSGGAGAPAVSGPARLEKVYREKIVPEMMQSGKYTSPQAVPRLVKIVLNMGVGEAIVDKKNLQAATEDLLQISGQKPIVTLARKSVAGFKIRKGYPIGCKVTLRRRRMYDFFDRLVITALPRSRDFRGLPPRAFDGRGNYNIGVREQIIFHEVRYESVDKMRGLDIAIETSCRTDEEARDLLVRLGLPLRD